MTSENNILNELQPDLCELLDLVRKVENFDATLAASQFCRSIHCTMKRRLRKQKNG